MAQFQLSNPSGIRARRSGARVTLSVVLVLQLFLALFGLAKAYAEPSAQRPQFTHIDVTSDLLPLTAESGFPLATQYAQQWHSDARLVSAMMHLDWPETAGTAPTTELPPDGFLLYLFTSGDKTISINLDRGSGNLNGSVISKQGGDVWKTLDLTTFQKTASIAGLTAEVVAGQAYRDACPDLRHATDITANIQTQGDGTQIPTWSVVYQQDRHNNVNDVIVRLNAATGDVLQKDVTTRSCDAPS